MVEKEEDQVWEDLKWKNLIVLIKADESDASFNPDPTLKTPKRKSSSQKRDESALDAESENEVNHQIIHCWY